MRISLVVAVGENGVIGRGGGLPWRIPSDLKTFRGVTIGKPVIMGRRTFQSLRRPLDGRDNIVVTRDPFFAAEGVSVAATLTEALVLARVLARTRGADEIMVIGGADVFRDALPFADRIYWTIVHGAPEGDTYFPALQMDAWRVLSQTPLPPSPEDEFACTLRILERVEPHDAVEV